MRRFIAATIGALIFPQPANLALAGDFSLPRDIEYPRSERESNWYLRGDIGALRYAGVDAHLDAAGFGSMINQSIKDAGTIGFGAGYRWNRSFRTDATLDYATPGAFHGNLICPSAPCLPGPLYSDENADLSAWTGLINAYFDFGSYGGINPYLGAGFGFAYVGSSGVRYDSPEPLAGRWSGAGSWDLAFALMVGASVNLAQRWTVDVNYRYLHLGNAKSGPTTYASEPIHYDGLAAQEVRLGLRYDLR